MYIKFMCTYKKPKKYMYTNFIYGYKNPKNTCIYKLCIRI